MEEIRKRIGCIEIRPYSLNGNTYEIVKWYKDETDKEHCYVILFLRKQKDNTYYVDYVVDRLSSLTAIENKEDEITCIDFFNVYNYAKILMNIIQDDEIEKEKRLFLERYYKPKDVEEVSMKNDRIDDKPMWELLPMQEIEDLVKVYTYGAKKYKPDGWQNLENGFERYRAALMRHIMLYLNGERYDKESGLQHLSQVVWNAVAMLWYDKHGKGLFPFEENKEEDKE